MDVMTYWKTYGRDEAIRVCEEAGTTYGYWKHLAHCRKRPGVDLAYRIHEASNRKIDVLTMLKPRADA